MINIFYFLFVFSCVCFVFCSRAFEHLWRLVLAVIIAFFLCQNSRFLILIFMSRVVERNHGILLKLLYCSYSVLESVLT